MASAVYYFTHLYLLSLSLFTFVMNTKSAHLIIHTASVVGSQESIFCFGLIDRENHLIFVGVGGEVIQDFAKQMTHPLYIPPYYFHTQAGRLLGRHAFTYVYMYICIYIYIYTSSFIRTYLHMYIANPRSEIY